MNGQVLAMWVAFIDIHLRGEVLILFGAVEWFVLHIHAFDHLSENRMGPVFAGGPPLEECRVV